MATLMAFVAQLGSPSILAALILSAVSLLELERRWTRSRRLAGRSIGPQPYILDGIAASAAFLAIVGGAQTFVHAATTTLHQALVQPGDDPSWRDGTVVGAVLGIVIALPLAILLARFVFRQAAIPPQMAAAVPAVDPGAAASTGSAAPMTIGQENLIAIPLRTAPAPQAHETAGRNPYTVRTPAATDDAGTDQRLMDDEPQLVMLRKRPARQPVRSAQPEPMIIAAPLAEVTRPQRSGWKLAVVLVLLACGTLGYMYREPALAAITAVITSPAPTTVAGTPAPPVIAATPAPPTQAPALQVLRVASDRLNLRAGPATDQPVVTTLARDDEVLLLGETSGSGNDAWVRVRAGETEGWVFRAFLK
ncbi:MAG: SH3 domain-containing protein [Chloroflexi bacterium]|nr:SH3 domain-containing protein [Chloroflexota bacterium]